MDAHLDNVGQIFVEDDEGGSPGDLPVFVELSDRPWQLLRLCRRSDPDTLGGEFDTSLRRKYGRGDGCTPRVLESDSSSVSRPACDELGVHREGLLVGEIFDPLLGF